MAFTTYYKQFCFVCQVVIVGGFFFCLKNGLSSFNKNVKFRNFVAKWLIIAFGTPLSSLKFQIAFQTLQINNLTCQFFLDSFKFVFLHTKVSNAVFCLHILCVKATKENKWMNRRRRRKGNGRSIQSIDTRMSHFIPKKRRWTLIWLSKC